MFKIEKNIPLPPEKPAKYPFKEMTVADSFFVTGASRANLVSAGNYYSQQTGKKFSVRKEGLGFRVYCIADPKSGAAPATFSVVLSKAAI